MQIFIITKSQNSVYYTCKICSLRSTSGKSEMLILAVRVSKSGPSSLGLAVNTQYRFTAADRPYNTGPP